MVMEKTLRLNHGSMKAIIPPRRTVEIKDYSIEDFKPSGNNLLDEWRIKRFSEYVTLQFPYWKRTGLKEISLPELPHYKGLESVDELGIKVIDSLDFEGSDRKFVLLADAFSLSGSYYVHSGVRTLVMQDFDSIDNSLIIVERGRLDLIRIVQKELFVGNLRILLKPGTELRLYNLYIGKGTDENSPLISNVFVEAQEGSKLHVRDFYFGGTINAGYFGLRVNGENVYSDIRPYYLGAGKTVIDILYLVRFYAGNSYSNVDAKGVLTDKSKLIFRGIMDITSGCKEAEAHQSNHALLLSEKAKVEAIPSLMVDEHEVVASHAASSAPVDEQTVFYLMSRGIPRDEAIRMIVKGVFETLKDELNNLDDTLKLGGLIEDALGSVVG
ncbi:SufB/SufD family protein [Fervidobacterium thailandense]|nr:SufD family Fe-S cluster assembly protein [Fervidobacterium thailandense]